MENNIKRMETVFTSCIIPHARCIDSKTASISYYARYIEKFLGYGSKKIFATVYRFSWHYAIKSTGHQKSRLKADHTLFPLCIGKRDKI